jgi:hypothetical protein
MSIAHPQSDRDLHGQIAFRIEGLHRPRPNFWQRWWRQLARFSRTPARPVAAGRGGYVQPAGSPGLAKIATPLQTLP